MFFSRGKSKLGIDIGTSSIKIAQLRHEANQRFLETYGLVNVAHEAVGKGEFDVIGQTAGILKRLLQQSGATTKKAVASLPNNIVFVSVIEVPRMSEKELKNAVEWEAQRYVPLPIKEVTLSWTITEDAPSEERLKILLTAVPTTVVENYLKMFKLAGLEPMALEIETLGLIRSLIGSRKDSFIVIDIGARSSSINLVDKGFLRVSRSLAVGGETISADIAKSLHISFTRAEQFKRDLGMAANRQHIPQTIQPVMENIKGETAQLINIFESGGGKVEEIIFAGAGANLPGLIEYFADLGVKARMGDPLQFVVYDEKIRDSLDKVKLGLSVALGLAMRP